MTPASHSPPRTPKTGNMSTANGQSNTELFNKIGEKRTLQPADI
jgi:hypothetical protein